MYVYGEIYRERDQGIQFGSIPDNWEWPYSPQLNGNPINNIDPF